MKIGFKGQKAMTRSVLGISSNFQNGLAVAFLDIGKVLVDDFHRQTQKKKSGRIYNYKGRKIRASAKGQTPANRSGNYYQSIDTKFQGWDQMVFGNDAEYADWLEHGTGKMSPRFGLLNSIKAKQERIEKLFDSNLAKKLKADR